MMKRATQFAILLLAFSVVCLTLTMRAEAQECTVYYPNISYINVQSCPYTDGNGAWEGPVYDRIADPITHEIGVVEVTETRPVYRVEIRGSGCDYNDYNVTLTCNGLTKYVSYYHDWGPKIGSETLTFDILPSPAVTICSTPHRAGPGNNGGFRVDWIKLYYVTTATVNIQPNSLNLRSQGQWITACIELSEGYDVNDINVFTTSLNDTVSAEPDPTEAGDCDSDGIPDLMVKFNRSDVIAYISNAVNMTKLADEKFMPITLTVTGCLNDGTAFQGSDPIRIVYVIPSGKGKTFLVPT